MFLGWGKWALIVGGVLLWSGHWQKDGVLVPFKRWQEWVVFGAALTSFTVLLTIGATRAARQGEALKPPDTGIEKQRPASSPPAKPKLVLWTTGDEGPLEYVIKHHPIEGDSPLGFGLTLRNQGTVTANRIRFRVEILTSSVDLKTIPPFTNQSRGPNDDYILEFPYQHPGGPPIPITLTFTFRKDQSPFSVNFWAEADEVERASAYLGTITITRAAFLIISACAARVSGFSNLLLTPALFAALHLGSCASFFNTSFCFALYLGSLCIFFIAALCFALYSGSL